MQTRNGNDIRNWWSQKINVSEIRAIMRDIIFDYKDDDEDSDYALAAQEVLDYLHGMRGKITRPFNVDNHTDFIMMRAGIAVLNNDRSLFCYTAGISENSKKIYYY